MKIYLSRSTTRSMMADYPIGNPTGGPAYGEKRDPISAVISIASMAGTYATAGSFAAMTMFQGITFAGAALSLIGNVTGNKTLSQIGMIAGIAGGVGSFADFVMGGAPTGGTLGDFGKSNVDISSVFAENPAPGSLTPVVDGQTVSAAANPMMDPAQMGALKAPNINAPSQSLQAPVNAPAPAGSSLTRSLGPAATAPTAADLGNAAAAPTVPSTDLGINPITGKANPLMSYRPGFGPNDAAKTLTNPSILDELKAGNYGKAAMAAGSGAMDMLKTNPTGAYVAAQAIGAGVDYLSGKTDAELDQLKASTGYANAKALEIQTALDREKARRANINASYGNVDAGIKVKQPGLVAGAMQQST